MKTFLKFFFAGLVLMFACNAVGKDTPPAGGPPKPINVPPHQDFTLPNGLKVTIIPYGDVPKVTVDIIVRSGNLNEAENQVWLADVTGDMMKEGTKTRTADQVAEEAAGMGGAISINVGPDQTQISSDALTQVYIAGKFDSATMRKAVTDALTKWPHGPEPQIDVPKPSTGRAFELTDKP